MGNQGKKYKLHANYILVRACQSSKRIVINKGDDGILYNVSLYTKIHDSQLFYKVIRKV